MFAADGSDIHTPTNPDDVNSFFPECNGRSSYNILHLDAMFDLLQHTYIDVNLDGLRNFNERTALCSMVDRSSVSSARTSKSKQIISLLITGFLRYFFAGVVILATDDSCITAVNRREIPYLTDIID